MMWGCRAETRRRVHPTGRPDDRPWSNRAREEAAAGCRGSSSRLLEDGGEGDVFEALKRFRAARDLHAQDRPLPGGEKEFREVVGRKGRGNLARGLRLGDAGRKRSTPFGKDRGEPLAQHVALRGGLQAEIPDQAAAGEIIRRQPFGDEIEIAPQALTRRKELVAQRLRHQAFDVVEIAVEHLAGEDFLRAEMIGERALGCLRLGYDVAHAGADVALAEHDLEAGVEDVVTQRWFRHGEIIRTYVFMSSANFRVAKSASPQGGP